MKKWVTIVAGLLAPTLASAECLSTSGAQIDVVTYNTWGLPAPIAKRRRARLPAISEWLGDQGFDVVGLQEVWRGALPMLRLDGLFSPSKESGDSGLALWSSHAVQRTGVEHFNHASGVDGLKSKGVQTSTVDVPGWGELAVWNTHLQAMDTKRSARVRHRQVDQILHRANHTDAPMVLMGDFNLYGDNPEDQVTSRRLQDAGFVDVASATGSERGTYPGEDAERFDRIYVRNGSEKCLGPVKTEVIDDAAPLSDHLPVRAVLSLGG